MPLGLQDGGLHIQMSMGNAQASPHVDHPPSAFSGPLHKLGKLFGLKTGSPSHSSNSRRSSPSMSRTKSPTRVDQFRSRPKMFYESGTHSPGGSATSESMSKVSGSRLNHSVSTPNMSVGARTERPVTIPTHREDKRGRFPVGPVVVSLRSGLRLSPPVKPRQNLTKGVKQSLSPTTSDFGKAVRRSSSWRTPEPSVSSLPRGNSFTPCASSSPVSKTTSRFLQPEPARIIRRHSTLAFTGLPKLDTLSSLFPPDNLHLTPTTSTESFTCNDHRHSKKRRDHSHRGSVDKLARTLGVCPPALSTLYRVGQIPRSPSYSVRPFSTAEETYTPAKESISLSKASKRMSLSLTTFPLPTLLRSRSPSHGSGKHVSMRSPSCASLSTVNTDDLHRFGLADDLSDTWGEIRDDSYSCSPISPITFQPPSPLLVSGGASSTPSDNMKRERESAGPFCSSQPQRGRATLARAQSQSYASSQPRSIPDSTKLRACTPFQDLPETETEPGTNARLPVKANWLDSVSPMSSEQSSNRHEDATGSGTESSDWTGEWNQNDMQQVIKVLRQLK